MYIVKKKVTIIWVIKHLHVYTTFYNTVCTVQIRCKVYVIYNCLHEEASTLVHWGKYIFIQVYTRRQTRLHEFASNLYCTCRCRVHLHVHEKDQKYAVCTYMYIHVLCIFYMQLHIQSNILLPQPLAILANLKKVDASLWLKSGELAYELGDLPKALNYISRGMNLLILLLYTLKLLSIAATNFSDFSEKPHNR